MWCSQHSITQTEGWDGGLWVSAPTTLTETQAPSVSWLPLFPGTWRQQVGKDNEDGTWEVFRARPGRGTHHARSHAITQDAVTWPPKCRRLGNGVSAHTEGRGHGKRRGQGVEDAQLAGLSRGKSLTREERGFKPRDPGRQGQLPSAPESRSRSFPGTMPPAQGRPSHRSRKSALPGNTGATPASCRTSSEGYN